MPQSLTPFLLRVSRSVDALRRLIFILVLAALASIARSAVPEAKRHYDLASGDATKTLRQFVEQSGEEVIYVVPKVRGVKTNAVKGQFAAREVIERMVANTALVVVADEKTGALIINRASSSPPAPSADPSPRPQIPTAPAPSPKPMKRNSPLAALGAWLALALSSADPATAAEVGTASLTGRVQNVVTGQFLNNARVTVRGTNLEAFTDQTGIYHLPQVPAGKAVVEVVYTGLDSQSASLELAPGQAASRDFDLTNATRYGEGGVVKLDSFTVQSSRETDAAAIAINEQRYAPNLKNVMSTDSLGDMKDGNIGEFLKFMPGVIPEYNDEDATTVASVSIRGFASNMVGVTTDGAAMASTSNGFGDSRSFAFNQVSINNISRVEVTKVPTPSNPADSLSGSVNMVSKSAFERKGAQLRYNVFAAANSENVTLRKTPHTSDENIYKIRPGGNFDYTLPITPNFGLVVTGAASERYTKLHYTYKTYNANAAGTGATPDKSYLQSFRLLDSPRVLTRMSAGLKADWRVTRNSVLSVGGQINHFESDRIATEFVLNAGTNAVPTPATGTPLSFGSDYTIGATGRGAMTMGGAASNHTVKDGASGNLRYRFDNGIWRIRFGVDRSRDFGGLRDISKGHFRQMAISSRVPVRVTFREVDGPRPAILQVFDNNNAPVNFYDVNNYQLTTANSTPRNTLDVFESGSADIRRDLRFFDFPFTLEIGGSDRKQQRDIKRRNENWTYNGVGGDRSPLPFLSPVYKGQYHYYGFNDFPQISPKIAWEEFQKNPALFSKTAAQLRAEELFRITNSFGFEERVTAGYAQTEFRLFKDRLRVLTGVRYEKTVDDATGPLVDTAAVFQRNADGTFRRDAAGLRIRKPEAGAAGSLQELSLTHKERATDANRSYDGYYPSLHLTYNISDSFIVRSAYAKTYGRPDFTDILPNAQVDEADLDGDQVGNPSIVQGNITSTNPGLRPWSADNYDLSLEYYTSKGGLFSVGAFHKEIKNFFGNVVRIATLADTEEFGLDPRYVGWRVTTKINAGDASVSGVEFNVRQTLTGLGSWGRYFTAFVNGTKLYLEGSNAADFNNFTPESINGGLTFSKRPFQLMVKGNYRGKRRLGALPALGPDAYEYNDHYKSVDVNAEYQLTKSVTFYLSASDVFNSPKVTLRYGPSTPDYAKRYLTDHKGVSLSMGIKGTF